MSVSWNDPAALQDAPDVVLDLLWAWIVSDLLLHVKDESQDFLVGKTMERTSETSKTSRVGEERIGKGGSDKVDGVGRDVSTFVVGWSDSQALDIKVRIPS